MEKINGFFSGMDRHRKLPWDGIYGLKKRAYVVRNALSALGMTPDRISPVSRKKYMLRKHLMKTSTSYVY